MGQIGLQNPICIWAPDDYTADLMTGHHRWLAAKKLGWKKIACFRVNDMSEVDRELWEIDENLIRGELSPAEEADHWGRRKELFELRAKIVVGGANHPTHLDATGRISSPQQQKQFVADAAEKIGIDKRNLNKAVARAVKIVVPVAELAGTSLDKGVELDALAKLPADKQKELAARAKAGEKVTARKGAFRAAARGATAVLAAMKPKPKSRSQNGETVTAVVVKELPAKNKKLREERDGARIEKEGNDAFVTDATNKFHEATHEIRFLEKEVERLKQECDASRQEVERCHTEIANLNSEIAGLRAQLDDGSG